MSWVVLVQQILEAGDYQLMNNVIPLRGADYIEAR